MHTPNQGDSRCANCKQAPCTCVTVHHMTTWMMTALLMTHSACKWRSNAIKQKNKGFQDQHISLPIWPIDCRNLYLRARLDTCADVNLMLASMYQLVFSDQNMKKFVPSRLQVGTYMTDTVKIVGSCTFHLVHPDTKRLLETTFYMAMNDGSVLLSCKTTLLLGLIQPRSRLDYLPPRASLITSSADHIIAKHWWKQENKASITCTETAGAHPKEQAKRSCSNTYSYQTGPQVDNKQRDDTARISRCLSRNWQIPGSRLPYTDWFKCTSK